MTQQVQQDIGVGIDETSCRMLLPKTIPQAIPGDAKSQRLAEKVAEARAKGDDSLLAKMWVYSGLHLAPYNIFDFRVSRHRDGPDDFFQQQPLQSAGRLLLGQPQRGASQRRAFGVRGLLGARAPQTPNAGRCKARRYGFPRSNLLALCSGMQEEIVGPSRCRETRKSKML